MFADRIPGSLAVRLRVTGRVQGVGFRYHVLRLARACGAVGWVRNREDGSVEVWAEGPADALELLEDGVRAGPAHARVQGVERTNETATGSFPDFGVRP